MNKAVDFVKKQIDEFEEKIFGKNSKTKLKTTKSKTKKTEISDSNCKEIKIPKTSHKVIKNGLDTRTPLKTP